MADDATMNPANVNSSDSAASAPKVKKTRAPRRAKAAAETSSATVVSTPVKRTRGPGRKSKTATAPIEAKATEKSAKPAKAAAGTKGQGVKRGPRKVAAASVTNDGFAELVQLEEENQKLRKALSDKLRSENADLRRKLGIK